MTIGELIIYTKKNDLPLNTEIIVISNDINTQGVYTSPNPNVEPYEKTEKEFVDKFTYDRFLKYAFIIGDKKKMKDCLVLRG